MSDPHPVPLADPSTIVREAISLLGSDPARAEALARQALAVAPDHPDTRVVLGTALRVRGDPAGARAVLEPLAAEQPGSWIVQFELARALLAEGLSRSALAPLSRAVQLNPGLGAGWKILGDQLTVMGDVRGAQAAFDRQLRAGLNDPRLQAAGDALAERRPQDAEQILRPLLAAEPEAPVLLHLLGEAIGRMGRWAEAEGLLIKCLERAPGYDLARRSLAAALFRAGRFADAIVQLDEVLTRDPGDVGARMVKAAALTELGDLAGAAELTAAVLQAFPDQPAAWMLYGNGLRMLGRTPDAVAAYGRALALDPDFSDARWSLANLKTYRFSAQDEADMVERLARPDLAADHRCNLHFTMGKVAEDRAVYAQAFGHYAQGNAIRRASLTYDPDRTTAFVQQSKAVFTDAFFAARRGWGAKAPDPIFIVGLPRSGSTLVEQILATHPQVEGTRELQELRVIADWLAGPPEPGRPSPYPNDLTALPRQLCDKLGDDYLDWTRAYRRQGRPRFTDKAPWNFAHVGLIQLILPEAKIVDVRRHPLGNGVSAFKQHFLSGWEFTYDLTELGRYYADYVALMAHYDAVLPGRVHRVIYERLVADPETETRRLLAYLDLPFDPACLTFFDNPRAVATPSSEQVRQPIFTGAVDQWRKFEPWLGPLKTALGPVLKAWRD